MQGYSDRRVWREAHALVLSVHRATTRLPRHEGDGLTAELRRAALAVGTNIVEGSRRAGQGLERALNLAASSLVETEYLLVVCRDLGYLPSTVTNPLIALAPGIARSLRTLHSIATDVRHLQSPMSDVSELAEICMESMLDGRDLSPQVPTPAKPPAQAPRRATSSRTADEPAVARSSSRARKACRARSRRAP